MLFRSLRLACVHAAVHGRESLEDEDLTIAAQMVLSPRATRVPANADTDNSPTPDEPRPPDEPSQEQTSSEDDSPPPTSIEPETLEDTILAAALASLPPKLLDQLLMSATQAKPQSSGGNSGQLQTSRQRGRPLSPRLGQIGRAHV